jgi:hypothetical protein
LNGLRVGSLRHSAEVDHLHDAAIFKKRGDPFRHQLAFDNLDACKGCNPAMFGRGNLAKFARSCARNSISKAFNAVDLN